MNKLWDIIEEEIEGHWSHAHNQKSINEGVALRLEVKRDVSIFRQSNHKMILIIHIKEGA